MNSQLRQIRAEIDFGLTFARIAESAYSEGQLGRGDSARGVARGAYERAVKILETFTPQGEELLACCRELEAALRGLEVAR